ncbi:MAG: ATP-binding protein [Fervidicoccaceae archaeon]|nr:ATP-binding protein [Fervidicoccaceae archaeon]
MSGLAFPQLKDMASAYARKAVQLDRAGQYEEAMTYYKRAIEVMEKVIRLYPESGVSQIYAEMIKMYRKRLKALESKLLASSVSSGDSEEKTGGEQAGTADDPFFKEIVLEQKPNITFDDIADLEHAKRAIREAIIYPVKRPDLFPLGWPRGILLFGPPGCGKTMIAAAVANEVDGIFIYADASNIMSKWLGEAEKNVAKLFKFARAKSTEGKPVIIFIDEIDALLGRFSSEVGGEARVRNQFLKEMDGLQDKDSKYHVYVIGATNKPWLLDDGFIRRFNKRIYIPLPNEEARLEMLKIYTKSLKLDPSVDLVELAKRTEGYSGSDIKDLVVEAHNRVVREYFEAQRGEGEPRPITMDDFLEVLKDRKPSVDKLMLTRIESWAKDHGA